MRPYKVKDIIIDLDKIHTIYLNKNNSSIFLGFIKEVKQPVINVLKFDTYKAAKSVLSDIYIAMKKK